jgi:hypothetical protein
VGVFGEQGELAVDAEDGGRSWLGEDTVIVLAAFVGRDGEVVTAVFEDVLGDVFGGLSLRGEEIELPLDGVTFTAAVRLTFRGPRLGSGLIGRALFSVGDRARSIFRFAVLSSFSSSELLSRRRVPVLGGDGAFFNGSMTAALGLYFGKEEDTALLFLGRNEAERVTPIV